MALFLGDDFEEMVVCLTCPGNLPRDCPVEWDGPSASADTPPAD